MQQRQRTNSSAHTHNRLCFYSNTGRNCAGSKTSDISATEQEDKHTNKIPLWFLNRAIHQTRCQIQIWIEPLSPPTSPSNMRSFTSRKPSTRPLLSTHCIQLNLGISNSNAKYTTMPTTAVICECGKKKYVQHQTYFNLQYRNFYSCNMCRMLARI